MNKHKRDKEIIKELRDTITSFQKTVTDRQCELKGMEIHPDKEMIEDIYKPLQQSLIESGREFYERELGVKISAIDKNLIEEEDVDVDAELEELNKMIRS